MKYLALIIFVFIQVVSTAQWHAYYKFNIKSKLETDVELSLAVHYQKQAVFKESDLIIKKINWIIKDSLDRFDVFEMYTSQRSTMSIKINEIFKSNLKELNVNVDSVSLLDVKIPMEAKLLNERFLELEQNYREVILEINNRKKSLEQKLQTDTKISDSERNEIEKEIMILQNYKYISTIYDKKIEQLIINN